MDGFKLQVRKDAPAITRTNAEFEALEALANKLNAEILRLHGVIKTGESAMGEYAEYSFCPWCNARRVRGEATAEDIRHGYHEPHGVDCQAFTSDGIVK